MSARVFAVIALAGALAGCDSRQAFREPEPTLARMLAQRRADPYEASSVFPDGKVMRAPPRGTIPVDDDADMPAPPVTRALVELGRERFETVCATCHGIRGDGMSVVATKMEHRPPPSLHEPRIASLSRRQIFDVATNGYGLMPALAFLVDTRERWAIAAYVEALHLSQGVTVAELPPNMRDELRKEAP